MRIDSTNELTMFVDKLRMSGVELPQNLTLEIDSNLLKDELVKEINMTKDKQIFDVNRFQYYGIKITFKPKQRR